MKEFMEGLLLLLTVIYLVPRNIWAEVDWAKRVDCYPKPGASEELCKTLGCIWDRDSTNVRLNIPLCYLPRETGYLISNDSFLSKDPKSIKNPFGADLSPLQLSAVQIGSVLNVKIGYNDRFDVPISLPREPLTSTDSFTFQKTKTGLFNFKIKRDSSGEFIWDTSIGGLLFADKFIQIATYLPTYNIYGFGEHAHTTLRHNFSEYTTWGMFARDEFPDPVDMPKKNLYGVHPFYLGLEKSGKAHGVLILNSHPQEITFGPSPHLVYRTTGGYLDLYFFPGPEPESVIKQYVTFIGKPFLPAYFAFGFQLCRYGYQNLNEMKETVARVRSYQIPFDVTYADIDHMDRYKDFTLGKDWIDFPSYTNELKRQNMHVVLIFDCAIQVDYETFQRAIEMNASFVEWERYDQVPHEIQDLYPLAKDTKIMLSVVWPDKHTAFPDFYDASGKTAEWWIKEFKIFHDLIAFDGIWIDMNEPAAFGTNEEHPWYFDNDDHPNIKPLHCSLEGKDSELDKPPYETANVYYYGNNAHLSTKTLCMSGVTNRGKYSVHSTKSLYGLTELIATEKAMRESTRKRGFTLSRSTFVSSGHYGGHWLGDNTARWEDLQSSVIGIQEFNMFGIPFIGADICGFNGNTTMELCHRWQQLGAFYPFSRNHNSDGQTLQDPGQWPSVAAATRQANLFRYYYLPYLYSLHFEASLHGGTVVRPVFFEFPNDTETYDLGYQFMWGAAMMIIPVVHQSVSSVKGYIPKATWYSLRDNDYATPIKVGNTEFSATKEELIPVLVRGGFIIPRQAPKLTTIESRTSPFELLIALDYDEADTPLKANGQLYWDDGESIIDNFNTYPYYHWSFDFTLTDTAATLYITTINQADLNSIPTLDILDIVGYKYLPDLAKTEINGESIKVDTTKSVYLSNNNRLFISTSNLIDLKDSKKIIMKWPHQKL